MALALSPERTLLVRVGNVREISDVNGINSDLWTLSSMSRFKV